MGGDIERPSNSPALWQDWGDGGREPNAVVPVEEREPSAVIAEVAGADTAAVEDDALTGLTEFQVTTARDVAEQILEDAPDDFVDAFDTLSTGLQRRIFGVMAARPNLRGLDLVAAVEDKLTLGEAAEAADWLRNLSDHHKAWLRGD